MPEGFSKVNEYTAVKISLASPEQIRSWSFGEVKKPETVNYRTFRPERDGLFCERIFGPEKDWECACGKYRGMKHKGIICDRCGVKVTHSRVRRKRMGHINLVVPVVHIWFFKSMPSRIANILGLKANEVERIIYFQNYVVIDPGDTDLEYLSLLSEREYRDIVDQYGPGAIRAGMGAEAIRELLVKTDLEALSKELREKLANKPAKQEEKNLIKRLKIIESLKDSGNRPEWMVLDVIPVIPPELRPLVPLDSGTYATSDLNDLYRRIINRNNRLKRLIELNAPDVIIRNEKRMLQQAVDALFDNSRCKRPVLGTGNRPLKSLADMIKGKQGRFRENLLGKRVDYSARSVIVVGPELRLHQCGLPKKIALELYQPFVIRKLCEQEYAQTIKTARRMIERQEQIVWDLLDEAIQHHPVLLNRAPTLHRMGIQAFEPVLVEGNAIRIHPLVCKGFNADFDGDQMAVHLPLSVEAQIEATALMLSTNNIFSPQSGAPLITPTQDMVLGCYYLTVDMTSEEEQGRLFGSLGEVILAYLQNKIGIHDSVTVRLPERKFVKNSASGEWEKPEKRRIETTVGRVLFNDPFPDELPFYNFKVDSKALNSIVTECCRVLGRQGGIRLLDEIKRLGFVEATRAGLSFATVDLKMPPSKWEIIQRAEKEAQSITNRYRRGVITEGERYNQIVDLWTRVRELVAEEMMRCLRDDKREGKPYLNPVFLMVDSGARGSKEQVSQLAAMRGLMAKPSGRIIETPIKANFREGLQVLEYFSSTHGARKGLADTALKTADSGYLTRKLIDCAQNVVIRELDCGTTRGISKTAVYRGDEVDVTLGQNILGRVVCDAIVDPVTDEVIVAANELVTEEKARRIDELGFHKIRVRSPLTCECRNGICAKCYGMDLARGTLVEEGLAVGIIAAQSIGEPGTQLTMRTFHIGGTASRAVQQNQIRARRAGVVRYHKNLRTVVNEEGQRVVLSRTGELVLENERGREIERYHVPSGAIVMVDDCAKVKAGEPLAKWDPHSISILAEYEGVVRYEEIVEGKTMRVEVDAQTGSQRRMITEHKGEMHPQIVIESEDGRPLAVYPIPEKAYLEVEDGEHIHAGRRLARTPREISGTQDITGGLPRVTELFEARKPKNPAVLSQISGVVELGERKRGKRTIIVRNLESGVEKEHSVPSGKHLRVHTGDHVRVGDPLVEGPLEPQEILRVSGEEALQEYLLREIQTVYRLQGVRINDKHIEIIIAQMMRRVRVVDPGDTKFLPGAIIDKFAFQDENRRVVEEGGKPGQAEPIVMGVTKAALHSDSFLSAASFQETPKVLTEAALSGKFDRLEGLKENVVLGRLIPAGTGYSLHEGGVLKKLPAPEAKNESELKR